MLRIIVSSEAPILSLKEYLIRQNISQTQRRLIRKEGSITVNGEPHPFYAPVKPGDIIEIQQPTSSNVPPIDGVLAIVYEDDFLLVVNKPAGILVHPTAAPDTCTLGHIVMSHYQKTGCSAGFHPVSRLDRNTSGLITIAKFPHIQHALVKNDSMQRTYLAYVQGVPAPSEGLITHPIARHPDSIIQRIVSAEGQPAQTAYHILQTFPNAALIELLLHTGRTHQIRVHMSHIGHPLLGDDLYGGASDLISRQALHAHHLVLQHPVTQKILDLSAPLPDDLEKLHSFLSQE